MSRLRIAECGCRIGLTAIFAVALALALVATPRAVKAQQAARVWRIGLMHVGLDHPPRSVETFRETLRALGYEEGKNLRLDFRNLSDEDAARTTAREFVQDRVDVIVAFENQTARTAKATTSEIPVVFVHVTDPVADGLVNSLSRPGGNMTGFAGLGDVPAKRLELFKELVPRLRRVLVLFDPQDPVTRRVLGEVEKAGAMLRLQLMEREVGQEADIEGVFRSLKRGEADGVFVASPSLSSKFSSLILRLASARRIPLASHWKGVVERGALSRIAAISSRSVGMRRATWTRSSKAQSRRTFRFRSYPDSSWPSISRPPRCSASRFHNL